MNATAQQMVEQHGGGDQLAPVSQVGNRELDQVSPFSSIQKFQDAQRMAQALAATDLVPQQYKGNVANCVLALEVAHRTGSSVLAVMQNLYVVQGRPSWSAQYIIGALNSCGRFDPLNFEVENEPDPLPEKWQDFPMVWRCRAVAKDRKAGELRKGPWVTIAMAHTEGWIQKKGSKWQSLPSLMLMYRAASFFGRLYTPEISLGMTTQEEAWDTITVEPATGEVLSVDQGKPAPETRTAGVAEKVAQTAQGGQQQAGGAAPLFSADELADRVQAAQDGAALDEIEDLARSLPDAGERNAVRAGINKRRQELGLLA